MIERNALLLAIAIALTLYIGGAIGHGLKRAGHFVKHAGEKIVHVIHR